MIERYQKLYTAAINDIFQERGLHDRWLGPDIKCRTSAPTPPDPALRQPARHPLRIREPANDILAIGNLWIHKAVLGNCFTAGQINQI